MVGSCLVNWEIITATLTILASGSWLIVYLAKQLSTHLLARDLENFKSNLKAEHDKALERLRADLRIEAFQRETAFSRLHDKRVEVIGEVYRLISVVNLKMNRLIHEIQISGGPSLEEQGQSAADAADAFLEYYLQHQIYFEEELCDQLQEFNQKMYEAWIKFGISKQLENPEARHAKWQEAWTAISDELPVKRRAVETAFRKILGHQG